MKIIYLKKLIIRNFAIAGAILVISLCSLYYRMHQAQKSQEAIDIIKKDTSEIKDQTESLQSKIQEIKKYKEVWGSISENQKSLSGIKIDNINSKIEQIGAQHNIFQPNIKVSFPENLKDGIFNISSSDMVFSSVDLSFIAISDVEALLFISDLIKSLPGYVVINRLSIKKTKEYDNNELIKISSGASVGSILSDVNFYWYVYKPKSKDNKDINQGSNQQPMPDKIGE